MTEKTRADFQASLAANIYDNNNGETTAGRIHDQLRDLSDSVVFKDETGSTVAIEQDGLPVAVAGTLNLTAGLTATDAGGGTVSVAATGGGAGGLTATVTALALSGASQTHSIASGTKFITLQSSAIVLSVNGRVQVQLKNGASTTKFSGVGVTDGGSPADFTAAGAPGLAPLSTGSTGNHYLRGVIHNPRDSGKLTTADIEGFSPGASQVYRRVSDADSATDDDALAFSPSAGEFSGGIVYITEWS